MLKLLLAAVVVALLLSAGLAVGLYHYWGWKGLIALPFLLIVLLWLAKTLVMKVVRGFVMKLFGMKGAVLEGASVEVHSIRPVAKPEGRDEPVDDEEDEEAEDEEAESPDSPTANSEDEQDAAEESDSEDEQEEEEEEGPKHYYEVELTISPTQAKCMTLWEPAELAMTSTPGKGLMGLADDTVASACECHVWNGSKFEEDDFGKYEGARRLKVVFAVDQGVRTAYLNYYGHSLAPISLPEWTPQPTEPAAPGT